MGFAFLLAVEASRCDVFDEDNYSLVFLSSSPEDPQTLCRPHRDCSPLRSNPTASEEEGSSGFTVHGNVTQQFRMWQEKEKDS